MNQHPVEKIAVKLVLDANIFIKQIEFWKMADEFYTTQEVVYEVKDSKAREFFKSSPVPITIMEPDSKNVKATMKMAKSSGNLAHLSRQDLRLIALARMLDVKTNDGDDSHLATHLEDVTSAGQEKGLTVEQWRDREKQKQKSKREEPDADGWVKPKRPARMGKKGRGKAVLLADDDYDEEAMEKFRQRKKAMALLLATMGEDTPAPAEEPVEEETPVEPEPPVEPETSIEEAPVEPDAVVEPEAPVESVPAVEYVLPPAEEEEMGIEAVPLDDDETGGKWITIEDLTAEHIDTGEAPSTVGLSTDDRAMQNVCLQMGLELVAPEGRIASAKRWAVRCSACNRPDPQPRSEWCRHCGNKALMRVVMYVRDGQATFTRGIKGFHRRGKRFAKPLPKPGQSGKRHLAPQIAEDDPAYISRRKFGGHGKSKGSESFFSGDISGPQSGVKQLASKPYWDRSNPNESRRRLGKRRKRNTSSYMQ
eukprot:gnl/Dysnectes_brevis/3436_a4340_912.p1 GENE.gnl/Dysnectes_brevis/3436_a4340_912~~gnl/Dysnectes_brevis/3436_a4340_912.p1  ORF type:complete len:479 (+),score=152.45 gnl/Dysnectes_brevis/3436_a4340_912:24-1460(+)